VVGRDARTADCLADKVDPPSAASASPDSEDAEGATEEDVVTLAVDSPLGSVDWGHR